MSFAERLKELRQAAGYSREELSERAGLGRGTLRDYEQGRREPSFASACQLADALAVSVEAFRDGQAAAATSKPRGVEEVIATHFPARRKAAGRRKASS